jgi:hypothetical protein
MIPRAEILRTTIALAILALWVAMFLVWTSPFFW